MLKTLNKSLVVSVLKCEQMFASHTFHDDHQTCVFNYEINLSTPVQESLNMLIKTLFNSDVKYV